MKVILLQDIKKIGKKGDVKEFSDGYVQNFLIPKKIAEIATKEKIDAIGKHKNQEVAKKEIQKDLILKEYAQTDNKTITIHRKVNSIGALFAKVEVNEIHDALVKEHQIRIPIDHIHIKSEIKKTGEYTVIIGEKQKIGKEFNLFVKVVGQ